MPGFTSQDDLTAEMSVAGKRLICPYNKTATTAPVASVWYHMWPVGGMPGAGVTYTGAALDFARTVDTDPGSLYTGGNKSPDFKDLIYMNGMATAGAVPPTIWLVDQVGYYPLTQSAVSQVFTNGTPPNRYTTIGQGGLQVSLVAAAAGGATASNITILTYVDQDGNAGATMPTTPAVAVTVSTAAPTSTLGSRVITTVGGPFLPLMAGDSGVQQLTNITFSAANTGLEALVLLRPLAVLPCPTALTYGERDLVNQISSLERVYDGGCLMFMVFFGSATGANILGEVDVAWG